LRRLLTDTDPALWHAYALFAARTGSLGRAEEALRKAVALPGAAAESLLALACVLWHSGVTTDAMYLEDARSVRA
jgi:Flp pilus assembly protein TadD